MNSTYKKIASELIKHKNIAIISHVDPEGDSLGSMLALGIILKRKGKKLFFLCADQVPELYHFLPHVKDIKNDFNNHTPIDCIVIVDCSHLKRIGALENKIKNSSFIINIDHHPDNSFFGRINLVEKAAAVGEQIYRLAKTMRVKINKDIALCLYTSILTDTGSFRYTNTTAETFAIASELIQHGIEPSKIARAIYENRTPSALKILGFCLNNAKLSEDNKVVWTEITQENLRGLEAKDEEVSGIVDYLRTIKNIEVTLIFHETKTGKIKVNFRSKDKINVCEIAKKFGGGGHYKAAGCQMEGKLEEVKSKVLQEVERNIALRHKS